MALTAKQTTIDDYKSKLGYGARSNLFLVELTLPAFLVNPVLEEEVRIMAEKFTMPPARSINEIAVPIAGETFKLAGDKSAEIDVTLSFKNTEDYRLRNMFELWIDTIQQDIVLFPGCMISYRLPFIEVSIRKALEFFGVIFSEPHPKFSCCPEPNGIKNSDELVYEITAARNLSLAESIAI